jgi:hypothetical protein
LFSTGLNNTSGISYITEKTHNDNLSNIYKTKKYASVPIRARFNCILAEGCMGTDIELMATAESCSNSDGLEWKYIITDYNSGDIIQYSYNFQPVPPTGKKGNKNIDILINTIEARLTVLDALPLGNYKVEWTLIDNLNNISAATQFFDVVDNEAPVPVFIPSRTILSNEEVLAKSFDEGYFNNAQLQSYDNCTPSDQLYFTYSPVLPDLQSYPAKWEKQYTKYGMNFFDIETGAISTYDRYLNGQAYGWHPEKNSASQKVFFRDKYGELIYKNSMKIPIYVWDNFIPDNDCDYNNYTVDSITIIKGWIDESHDVEGRVITVKGKPIKGMIMINDNELETLTGENGLYKFKNVPFSEFTIKGYSKDNYRDGISTLDLLLIQRYILGLYDFNSPYKLIAADANGDKRISANDLVELANLVLGRRDTLSNVSRLAILTDYHFSKPDRAYKEVDKASTATISDFDFFTKHIDFYGIKIGDVNFSSDEMNSRDSKSLELSIENKDMNKNRYYEIPVYSKDFNNVFGMQYSMELKNLNFKRIKPGVLHINENNYNIINNKLLFTWNNPNGVSVKDGEILFKLAFGTKANGDLKDFIKLVDLPLENEYYYGNEFNKGILQFVFTNKKYNYTLYQNAPNPFINSTKIGFELENNEEYTISIYDLTGNRIATFKGQGTKGYNFITINKNQIVKHTDLFNYKYNNIFVYRLKTSDFVDYKKMNVIELK